MASVVRRWFGDEHEAERLSALLDDELEDDEALEVTRHVGGCDHCLAELERIREARGALRELPLVTPPGDYHADVLATPQTVAASGTGWSRIRRMVAAAAASVVLVAAAAFLAGGEPSGTVKPPVEVFVVDHVARDSGPGPKLVDLGR